MSAEVESASDYTGRDEGGTLTIKRPRPENIREVQLVDDSFRADLLSPTFFPPGLGFVREMEQLDFVKPIVLRMKQMGRRRHYTISPICFHAIRKDPDADHYLCEGCAYALDARMCVKAGGCPECRRGYRTRGYAVMETIGSMREARSLLLRSHFMEGILWCLIYTYQSKENLATLRQVRFLNRELRAIHRPGANKRGYHPSSDDKMGIGSIIDHEPLHVATLRSKAKSRAKRTITGTPEELMEAREAEFDVTDVWKRSMRRDEAPFIFPVTSDPELEGCDDLLRARRRGYALVRYQPHYLTTLIRMRTPFLEKQNDRKRKGARTSPDFSSPALTRSELKKRQRRAENRRNDEGIHDVPNLEPLWREKRDDDTIEMQGDDESDSTEQIGRAHV